MEKIKKVLLVDDDSGTNFLHNIVLRDCECVEQVNTCTNGKKALDYLLECGEKHEPVPEIIFLDINMPVMDGWEFLDEFERLPAAVKGSCIIIMLTTSINPDDEQKALAHKSVAGFRHKPLTRQMLEELRAEIGR
jgi:CheY-like chemotaxis protein